MGESLLMKRLHWRESHYWWRTSSLIRKITTGEEWRASSLMRRIATDEEWLFILPDPNIERPLVRIGMCVRLQPDTDWTDCWEFCAFIRSLRWVELLGGGDLRDKSALPNTNAGPNVGRRLPLGQALRCP